METKDTNEIGALWLKEAKSGTKYFSGIINGENIVIFKNNNKRLEKHPDYIVLKSEPKAQGSQSNVKKVNDVFNDEEIPF